MTTHPWFTNEFSEQVWLKKYAGKYTDVESFYRDLAKTASLGNDKLAEDFFRLMWEKKFSPGGRILAGNGRNGAKVSWMNCTTHEIEGDTLEEIAHATEIVMRASSRGQGIGINLSKLRPRGAKVNNSAITSTGAISFMELINHAGGIIGQEGRRAALLFNINDTHPDLWIPNDKTHECQRCHGFGCPKCNKFGYIPYDFINVKRINGKVTNANISVNISDAFIEAVKNDENWELYFETESSGGKEKFSNVVGARDLFRAIASSAFASAEPGVLFVDTTKKFSNSDLFGSEWEVVGVNACTEQLLDQEGVCNLGSMNLGAYVVNPFTEKAYFDYVTFDKDVKQAVEFLDNILDIELRKGNHISEKQRQSIINLRRIGLGVMGYADALAMLGIRYGTSFSSYSVTTVMFSTLRDAAYAKSAELAERKGAAKVFDGKSQEDLIDISENGFFATLPAYLRSLLVRHGLRNVSLLSVAPTGSISNLLGVSSGIEPLFALEYVRRYRMNGHDEFINYVHPVVILSRLANVPDNIWRTAYQVSPREHVEVQSIAQLFVDQSISKTTNMPSSATIEDVENVYMLAHELGLKGIAIYVDGSRDIQILHEKEECPVCEDGGKVINQNGCKECLTCGWSVCTT